MAVLEESGRAGNAIGGWQPRAARSGVSDGLRGSLQVTLEAGTYSAWLFDVVARKQSSGLQPRVKMPY